MLPTQTLYEIGEEDVHFLKVIVCLKMLYISLPAKLHHLPVQEPLLVMT